MSHKMEGKTSLTVENNDCIEEALQEAMPNATILKNEICNGIRERCDTLFVNQVNMILV